MHTRSRHASRIDALEPRRLFALSNDSGTSSTVTGTADYQSIDVTLPIPGGYVVAGTFGAGADFGNGLPSVAPRGATDVFLSVVKGKSASLRTIGGGESSDGKLKFKDDRADYTGAPERVDEPDYIFPLNGRAARADEYVTKIALGPDGKLYVALAFRRPISLDTQDKHAATLTPERQFKEKNFDSVILRYTIDGANLKLDRTTQIGGPFNDLVFDMAFADDGDLLVSGSFERECDFDPTSGTHIVNPAGRDDGFVARYGSGNKLEWVKQFGGDDSQPQDLEAAYAIAVSNGKVYVGGTFARDAEFDRRDTLSSDGQNGSGEKNVRLKADKKTDGFTLQLDASDGRFNWVVGQGGGDYDAVRDLAIAPDGGVYNLGYFQGKADLDPSPTREQTFEAASEDDVVDARGENTDLFFTRLDADGKLVWVKPLGGEARELIGSISSTSNGDLTIAGSFAGTIDVDPSKRVRHLTSTETDINDRNGDRNFAFAGFVATYGSNGAFRRSQQIDGQRDEDLFVLDANRASDGRLLIGGRYLGGFTVSGSDLRVTTQKKPTGREDGFAILI